MQSAAVIWRPEYHEIAPAFIRITFPDVDLPQSKSCVKYSSSFLDCFRLKFQVRQLRWTINVLNWIPPSSCPSCLLWWSTVHSGFTLQLIKRGLYEASYNIWFQGFFTTCSCNSLTLWMHSIFWTPCWKQVVSQLCGSWQLVHEQGWQYYFHNSWFWKPKFLKMAKFGDNFSQPFHSRAIIWNIMLGYSIRRVDVL